MPTELSGVRVEWSGHGDPARAVRRRNHLVSVAFLAYRRSTAGEVLQHETAYPDAGYLDIGHDVAGTDALDSGAAS